MSCNLKNDATYIFDDTKKFRLIFRLKLYSTSNMSFISKIAHNLQFEYYNS